MPGLAAYIGTSPGRMVIDRTGLSGRFDVDVTYTPSAFTAAALAQRGGGTPPPGVDPNGPPLLTALQEQLGVKLEPVKAPVEVLVIDRVEPLAQ
jgi:bla regulator protein blaR1